MLGQRQQMLVEKYGTPTGGNAAKFTDKYAGQGRYVWTFAKGMQLVYKREFFGNVDLTYVDSQRFDEVRKLAEQGDEEQARSEARKKNNAF